MMQPGQRLFGQPGVNSGRPSAVVLARPGVIRGPAGALLRAKPTNVAFNPRHKVGSAGKRYDKQAFAFRRGGHFYRRHYYIGPDGGVYFYDESMSPDDPMLAAPDALAGMPVCPADADDCQGFADAGVVEMNEGFEAIQLVGRWGYGAYHDETDRARTEAVASGQCGQPMLIDRGPNGGVMMYLADSAQLQELNLKGSPSGENYIGPPGPAGGVQDREIVSFDGRTMVLRWMNPDVATRYGTGVYVRCAP